MKILKIISVIMLIISTIACEKDSSYSDKILGYWLNPIEVQDSIYTYEKANKFDDDAYGFSFQPNNMYIEHKNSGWCGTPPVSYGNFSGNWNQEGSIIDISIEFWGGITKKKWKVISVDNKKLKVRIVKIENISDNKVHSK